jgi:hypothetical protein
MSRKIRCSYTYKENEKYYKIYFDTYLEGKDLKFAFNNIEFPEDIDKVIATKEIQERIDYLNSDDCSNIYNTPNYLRWYLVDHVTNGVAWDIENLS